MVDPVVRRNRLVKDLEKMELIRCPAIQFEAFDLPHPERYEIKFRLRSLLGTNGDTPTYSPDGHLHHVEIKLTKAYPENLVGADVRFLSVPIFHPNVYVGGTVCIRSYNPSESLANFVLRLARYIQCDPGFTGLDSPANPTARDFFVAHPGLFPTDRTVLPTGEKKLTFTGNIVEVQPRKTFVVHPPAAAAPVQKKRFVVSGSTPGVAQ